MERHIEGVTKSLAATGALIRSQFRPKLRYRNLARGMGVPTGEEDSGRLRAALFRSRPERCVAQLGLDRPEALRLSRAWDVREVREFLSGGVSGLPLGR
jgi:hypothetical protein